jgi:hypothetical protein
VGRRGVVVRQVYADQTSEMEFVEHDDMIVTAPANRPTDGYGEGILPGSSRGDDGLAKADVVNLALKVSAVDGVAIAEAVDRTAAHRGAAPACR